VALDPAPAKVGLIHIPEKARGKGIRAEGYTGRVLAVQEKLKETPHSRPGDRFYWADTGFEFAVGDRVCVGLHADELTEEVVVLHNDLVVAVIE
jgi:hypothetical protein